MIRAGDLPKNNGGKMMSKKSKKISTPLLVGAIASLVFLILAIVGISLENWVASELLGESVPTSLSDCTKFDMAIADTMSAFAIITIIAAAATVVGAIASLVLNFKLIKLIAAIAGAAAIVCAVITIICTYSFCNDTFGNDLLNTAPSAGAWLLTIGGALSGLAGAFTALKR